MLSNSEKTDLEATLIIQPIDMDNGIVEYAFSSHIGTREYQQDTVEVGKNQEGVYFGVLCDGMGGLDDGGLASFVTVKLLVKAICRSNHINDIPGFLVSQAHILNNAIYTLPSGDGDNGIMGTTLAAAMISKNSLYWLSVGDSRVYIVRGKEIVRVTRDHNYALELNEQVRAGLLSEEEAAADTKREALISFLGMEALRLIDFNKTAFPLEPDDTVLLCSDGLYRSLSDSDILQIILMHSGDLEECARVLPLYAFDRAIGSHDNTSVILLRYQNGETV